MSINSVILSVTRRTKKGLTVGEIFDRLENRYAKNGKLFETPLYSSVRAQVARLAKSGKLQVVGARRDPLSNRNSATFRRASSN